MWVEAAPDPLGQMLAGWVFEPFDLIQIAVVQLFEDWPEGSPEISKIHNPPGFCIRLARNMDAYPE